MNHGPHNLGPNLGRWDYQPITYRDPYHQLIRGEHMNHVSDSVMIEVSAGRAFDKLETGWRMGKRKPREVRVYQACVQVAQGQVGNAGVLAGRYTGDPDCTPRERFIADCLETWREAYTGQKIAA